MKKKPGGVAQGVVPKFKPQYSKKGKDSLLSLTFVSKGITFRH
jgi:hypothetical protein